MITDTEARRIASEWHGGQWTGLYALSSSGAIIVNHHFDKNPDTCIDEHGDLVYVSDPDILAKLTAADEIKDYLKDFRIETDTRNAELQTLTEYIQHHGPRGPVPGWSKLTW